MDDLLLELEINTNDASIDTRYIPSFRRRLKGKVAGILAFCTIFSGSLLGNTEVHAEEPTDYSISQTYDIENGNQVIEIPEVYQEKISYLCGKNNGEPITINDLRSIDSLYEVFTIEDNSSLEWMNYLGKIDYIKLSIKTEDTTVLKQIQKLNNTTALSLTSYCNGASIIKEDFSFVKESTNITELCILGFHIEPGFLEELTHLKKLKLDTRTTNTTADYNYKTDFTKLTFLDELEFPSTFAYDIAVDLSSKEYNTLKKAGVKITFINSGVEKDYLKISAELDEVVESLGVDENSTDQEKLDAILIHVLDELTYDPEVSEAIRTNTEHSALSGQFYTGGGLYGALEKDTSICGNYAAYVAALAERLALPAYYLVSDTHAWNLVIVDGEEYYVDATWLDGDVMVRTEEKIVCPETGETLQGVVYAPVAAQEFIKSGDTELLEWYMEEPSNYPYSEYQAESHEVINLPSFIKIDPKMESKDGNIETPVVEETIETPEDTPIEITNEDKFEVTIGDKKWIIGGAAAIGIMAGVGAAVVATKKKKEEMSRRQRHREMDDMMWDYDDYYNDDYTSSSFNSRRKR